MIETALFYLHGALLLVFGVFLSAAFSGVRLTRKTCFSTLTFCLLCGLFQLLLLLHFSEPVIWAVYPLIVHVPTVLFLIFFFRKNFFTATVSLLASYLFCQPAKWVGLFVFTLSENSVAEYSAKILTLLAVGAFSLKYAAPCLRMIFNKDIRSTSIFGIVPAVYYIFDYVTVIYTGFWMDYNLVVAEFLPLLLCLAFLLFCMVYYREYEQKADAERKEQIVRIVSQQQAVYIENVKQREHELRVAHHDMRHFLDRLSHCIDMNDTAKAKEMLQAYSTYIDGTKLTRFCGCDTVNYVLSAFSARCAQEQIDMICDIHLDYLEKDELLFCSILQNALDNAYNAQLLLDPPRRNIHILLNTVDEKLLLSVKNPTKHSPLFADGIPVSTEPGHGYGTQSIRYLSERLNGSCQFSVRDGLFILRVII